MRVVIDTGVFVGARLGVGASNAVFRAGLQHRFVPLLGEALLAEYEALLGRDALLPQCRLDPDGRSALLDAFLKPNTAGSKRWSRAVARP